jgi:P pilus assembly chaperone PapD
MTMNPMLRHAGIAALFGLLGAPLASAFGIGLQPTTVEMEVEPGGRNRQVIHIANVHTEKTISLTLGLADWTLDDAGQIELTPPGEADDSAAQWVRFSPAFITLKPGESQQVVVDTATPSRLERSGDFRFALIASTVLPEERGGGSGVWKKYQLASLFYLTAGDAKSSPVITRSGVSVTPEGGQAIDLRIENGGNAHARLEGTIEISGANPQSLPIGNLVVLHGGARDYSLPLTAPLSADAKIEVKLENIFAPQIEGATETLPSHTVATTIRKADVTGSAASAP